MFPPDKLWDKICVLQPENLETLRRTVVRKKPYFQLLSSSKFSMISFFVPL